MRILPVLGLLLALPAAVHAQVCKPGKNSNEANILGILGVPMAFSAARAPDEGSAGALEFGLEFGYLPNVDSLHAIPTVCNTAKNQAENTDLLFAFPRPRLIFHSSQGFFIEGSWIPPIRLNGVKASVFGFALGRTVAAGPNSMLRLRLHATFGTIHAAISCNAANIARTGDYCFGGQVSDDSYKPTSYGGELALGWSLGGGRFRPYLGGGYNMLRPRYQVNFTDQFNTTDRTKVEVNINRIVLFGGATWALTPSLGVSGEIYSAPSDAVTGRLMVTWFRAPAARR